MVFLFAWAGLTCCMINTNVWGWKDWSLNADTSKNQQQYHQQMDLTFTLQSNTMIGLSLAGVKVWCFMLNPANISVCRDTSQIPAPKWTQVCMWERARCYTVSHVHSNVIMQLKALCQTCILLCNRCEWARGCLYCTSNRTFTSHLTSSLIQCAMNWYFSRDLGIRRVRVTRWLPQICSRGSWRLLLVLLRPLVYARSDGFRYCRILLPVALSD